MVKCTNIYLQSIRANFYRIRDVTDTDVEEVKAVFGILYMAGILKSSHTVSLAIKYKSCEILSFCFTSLGYMYKR